MSDAWAKHIADMSERQQERIRELEKLIRLSVQASRVRRRKAQRELAALVYRIIAEEQQLAFDRAIKFLQAKYDTSPKLIPLEDLAPSYVPESAAPGANLRCARCGHERSRHADQGQGVGWRGCTITDCECESFIPPVVDPPRSCTRCGHDARDHAFLVGGGHSGKCAHPGCDCIKLVRSY